MGRQGDAMIGHLTPGDVVIPKDIALEHPEFLTKLKKIMQDAGSDYKTHVAGSGYENINPETGAPEFFFSGLRSFIRNPGKQIKSAVRNPGNLVMNTLKTGQVFNANPLLKQLAAPLQNAIFGGGGEQQSNAAAPSSDLGGIDQPFTPKRGDEPTKPYDLFSSSPGGQAFGTMDPMQQRSYLATEGTYGGGLSDENKQYYLSLLKRNLIDESGTLQDMNNYLMPVERNYLSRLGLPTDDTSAFYQAFQ